MPVGSSPLVGQGRFLALDSAHDRWLTHLGRRSLLLLLFLFLLLLLRGCSNLQDNVLSTALLTLLRNGEAPSAQRFLPA